jgi:hypothetical protein
LSNPVFVNLESLPHRGGPYISQDLDLITLIGERACEAGIFLAKLAFTITGGPLMRRLSPPLIDLPGVEAELASRGSDTCPLSKSRASVWYSAP